MRGKPVLVNIKTVIGHSSKKQNTGAVHGAALGDEDVRHVKGVLGFNPDDKFVVPPKVYDLVPGLKPKGAAAEVEWNKTMEQYAQRYPAEYKQLQMRLAASFPTTTRGSFCLPRKTCRRHSSLLESRAVSRSKLWYPSTTRLSLVPPI
jgi:transketolase